MFGSCFLSHEHLDGGQILCFESEFSGALRIDDNLKAALGAVAAPEKETEHADA